MTMWSQINCMQYLFCNFYGYIGMEGAYIQDDYHGTCIFMDTVLEIPLTLFSNTKVLPNFIASCSFLSWSKCYPQIVLVSSTF